MTIRKTLTFAPAALLLLIAIGCNSSQPEVGGSDSETAADTTAASAEHSGDQTDGGDATAAQDHGDHGDASGGEATEEGLAKLSEDERVAAMEQEVCPVSGQPLGSMGAPKKLDLAGESIWICCDSCEEKVRAEPEKYLAKLESSADE